MDPSQFDHLSRAIAASGSRRALSRVLAILPLVGSAGLLTEEAEGKRRQKKRQQARKRSRDRDRRDGRDDVGDEKKKKGKAWFCLNGQSIQAPKSKKKKLLKQGATPGQCPPATCTPDPRATTCNGKCGSITNNCGTTVDCGSCACDPPCDACFDCDETSRTCVVTEGVSCGSTGQVCDANGECACTSNSCPACQTCGNDGACAGCAGCCDGDTCVEDCGDCRLCGNDGQCRSCPGCCDTAGECQDGNTNAACGDPGATCAVCTGQDICVNGECACQPTTCAAQGKTCGEISDGCGDTLDCGNCEFPNQPCTNNVCGTCVPDCAAAACSADDGCGSPCLNGSCSSPETCGGGGTAGECGCTPSTCEAEGKTCGQISDGCFSTLECGTCPYPGQPCIDNVCGACVPTTCEAQGKNCGEISDGCGAMLDCGSCALPGQPCTDNVCGVCVPTTCVAQGKNCGSINNGCGNTLSCGTCSNPEPVCSPNNVCTACSNNTECLGGQLCCGGSCVTPVWVYQTQLGSGTAGNGTGQLSNPLAVAVSPDGLTVWIADGNNNRIAVWSRTNAASTTWAYQAQLGSGTAGSGTGQFRFPTKVAVSPDGLTAWIADVENHRIAVWSRPDASSTTWTYQTQLGSGVEGSSTGQFRFPYGVAVSPDGLTAWIADTNNHRIAVWSRPDASSTTWTYQTQLGSGTLGSGTGQFKYPLGVAVSPDGLTAWIADTNNHRIAVWTRPDAGSTSWTYQTQLGSGTFGSGTGQFYAPFTVAVSPDGLTAWIADAGNHRIAVWSRPDAGSTSWTYQTQLGSGTAGSGTGQFERPTGVAVSPDGLTAWIADSNNRIAVWQQAVCSA